MKWVKTDMQDETTAQMLGDVELPLKNLEFTIQQYLMAHGTRLDTDTRVLLAGIRDCVGRMATLSRHEATLRENAMPDFPVMPAMCSVVNG